MRKLILTLLLAVLSVSLFAQTLDDIKKYVVLQRWEDAKGQLDKYLAVEKNAKLPEGWYYKGYIYSELAKLPNYAGTDTRMESFNAFKKYQEMDPKNALMKDDENLDLFGLYNAYFDDAATKYNSKKYDVAFKSFKNALTVEDYIKGKGFSYKGYSFPVLDTQLLQNTALSAYLSKDSVNAAIYYQKIADAKVRGDAYLEIYQFLVEYFEVKMDIASRDKYFAIGRELYPDNDYWLDYEWKQAGNDKQKKEAVIAKYPNSYSLHYNYAAELFNSLYTGDQKPADYAGVQAKLEAVAKQAIAIKSGPEANLLLARHYYNEIYDLDDAIAAVKGTKPDDVKKKNDLVGQLNRKYDEMLPYATAVYNNFDGRTGLKPGERGNFKLAINLLLSYWENKKDAAKIKEYQDKMKSVE
jgi:hypothetical protein